MIAIWIFAAYLLILALLRFVYHQARRRGLTASPAPAPLPPGNPLILDGQTSFWDMVQQHETVFPTPPQMKPYDYWRDKFIASGDLEDLRQMERFVD